MTKPTRSPAYERLIRQINECPRCGGSIPNNETPGAYSGAISRLDNETEICSQCGTEEAMIDFAMGTYREGGAALARGWKVPLAGPNDDTDNIYPEDDGS